MRNSTSSRDASSPAKRRKHDPELVANDLDVWQEFAAEHYEMVEQYPLELHRNFRLLRELDDECIAQTEALHRVIRSYVSHRLGSAPADDTRLPEIGRLTREIVRNGEEKLAIAVGAYDSVDRHIRVLDMASSTQETSILLGLRPDTIPSAAIDDFLHADGTGKAHENVAIGMGGSGRRKKKGKGEKAMQDHGMEIHSTEPIYCYCQMVSYGEMIACENDECPYEWFHLPCTELVEPPAGDWYCKACINSIPQRASVKRRRR